VVVFERIPYLVRAWRVPLPGSICEEIAPPWLVERLQSRNLELNMLGGLNYQSRDGIISCIGGDFVLLTDEDEIEFCKEREFNSKYRTLDHSLAA
jgi:hypothetical protein